MDKKIVISNAFSINMLRSDPAELVFRPLTEEEVRWIMASYNKRSIVGHASVAALIGVPCNRETYKLDPDCEAVAVAQYKGPRLQEGATSLPEGATIEWWLVKKRGTNVPLAVDMALDLESDPEL